ncbi:MAG: hypothetical protein FWE29_01230 [Defluviitaleaceae bacterium]|nr:hypothetical protein [Defluviitaleaceae bacterium]
MRNINAVFIKQMQSFFKNPAMYGAPMFFLGIPFFILLLVADAATDRHLIISQFVVMFIGISMIATSSGFIMEDRSTMNLRFMGMAGVKPYQYLIGTCTALLIISIGAIACFGIMLQYSGEEMAGFLIISLLGAVTSMLLGITLSLSKIGGFTGIIGLLLGVGPIFAEANEVLANIFHFTYTMQITVVIREGNIANLTESIQIVVINMIVILIAFLLMNTRTGLDGEKIQRKEK